jgi:hypothetical protein
MTHAMRFRTRITNRKKTKRQVIFLHPKEEREREREREQHAIILPSDPLLRIQPRISHPE